jgi:hypothetical protein
VIRRVVAGVALALLSVSCVGDSPDVSGDLRNVGPVTVTFKVEPARVKVGQSVRFTFRLVNNAGRDERLTFPTGQHYDFWTTRGTTESWRWSEDRVFIQTITTQTILPQGSLTLSEFWKPERAGRYIAHGRLTAQGYERELTGRLVVE